MRRTFSVVSPFLRCCSSSFVPPASSSSSSVSSSPPLLAAAPFDDLEFNTRHAASILIFSSLQHHAALRPSTTPTPSPSEGVYEYNTVDIHWNVSSNPHRFPIATPAISDTAAAVGCSSGVSAVCAGQTKNVETGNRVGEGGGRVGRGTTEGGVLPPTVPRDATDDWQCAVCAAVFLHSYGDGGRMVCSVCLTRRLDANGEPLTPPLPRPDDGGGGFRWRCARCSEINVADVIRNADGLLGSREPSSRLHVASASAAARDMQHRRLECRCCGSISTSSAARGGTESGGGGGHQQPSISIKGPLRSGSGSEVKPSQLIQFQPLDSSNPSLMNSPSSSLVERINDRLMRWHCVSCSMGNRQHETRCSRCNAGRFSFQVSCPRCRHGDNITIEDVVLKRNCPNCQQTLHGALLKGTHSLWVCTCGMVGKQSTCVRCRAPRTIPTEPPDMAERYITGNQNGGPFDFGCATSWSCANCYHINQAAFRCRRAAVEDAPSTTTTTRRSRRKRTPSHRYASIQLNRDSGEEDENGGAAGGAALADIEIIRGQHSCGHCKEPWHAMTVSGGRSWRCACHHINHLKTSGGGGDVCASCGRSRNTSSNVTLSFWMPGDWTCVKCFRHNYRRSSICRCGAAQQEAAP